MSSMDVEGNSGTERDFLEKLDAGQVIKGVVSSIADFGAFVDLGAAEGLISVPQLSWSRIDHPSEVVHVGQEVTVTILNIDLERAQIWLSLKSLQPDPFQVFARTQLGNILHGHVTKLTPIGVFVRVDKDVEGLIPASEFTRDGAGMPRQAPKIGDEIIVRVAGINVDKRRVGLQFP
ncbi:S1 RNA-binding domain-containing protein [Sphaerisporangium album]|uniref:S1 RNA-binding domain-containing protein n=1 Tax=Sphaerisporangium album TaxID=509200 RepID=A0A367FQQ8_9ACTN|nr:S1 RNA-binding domain-containing protein [Sphaerisporangium album]RCG32611.1 S1 RNA-binding domain-containing protein [Sphaerisporangium album]